MSIALHTLFPVQSQSNYVASVTPSQAREQLEEYIERLEFDFGTIRGEHSSQLNQEKMQQASSEKEV